MDPLPIRHQTLLARMFCGCSRRVAEQAVTAIASVADVAEADFAPYYGSFMPGLKAFLRDGDQSRERRVLRGKSMECISLIGVAVGAQAFAADAKEVMDLLLAQQEGLELEPPPALTN